MTEMPPRTLPFPPMEAELIAELPDPDGWQYEPKWDGFRGVLENDGGELALWSRNARPLLRYFPELRRLGEELPPHSALDGEIVISRDGRLDFDAMQMRLHPAESRIKRLAAETPAQLVAFDVLLWKKEPVWKRPLEERRFSEPNRWGTGELEEAAVRPELVVEVRYDKVQGNRFRHGTKLIRWRDDKDPKDCTWRELRPPRDPDAPTIDALLR